MRTLLAKILDQFPHLLSAPLFHLTCILVHLGYKPISDYKPSLSDTLQDLCIHWMLPRLWMSDVPLTSTYWNISPIPTLPVHYTTPFLLYSTDCIFLWLDANHTNLRAEIIFYSPWNPSHGHWTHNSVSHINVPLKTCWV